MEGTIGQVHQEAMTVIHGLLGSVSTVFTIHGFWSLIYSSPTETFSAQAPPNMPCMTLHVVITIAILLYGATQFA